ncbi:MAG: hypothetical protein ACPLVF_02025 [Thermovenabulum sp.]|uniref:preprotein translocase subunit SecA n=1 Tax=Thermovenabulum sp. TaxID=3100335 RepID=UPI003C7CC3AB
MNEIEKYIAKAVEKIEEKIKIKPYTTQIKGAIELAKGKAVEMNTGEGKTIAIALSVPYMATKGKVYVVTTNNYLARRDGMYLKEYYESMGLKVAINSHDKDKRQIYSADVIYTSSSDFIFDYLFKEIGLLDVEIPLDWAILDEVDFILIDSSNSTFSVSLPGISERIDENFYKFIYEISNIMKGKRIRFGDFIKNNLDESRYDFIIVPYNKTVYLTEKGYDYISKIIGEDLHNNMLLTRMILKALEAKYLYRKNKDYIIEDGKIVLINRYNGRIMPNSYLESDLHTMIEVKEKVAITEKPFICYTMSYPIFFRKFKNISGTSGTIMDSKWELNRIYGMSSIKIKPYKKEKYIELEPKIFLTKNEKHRYIIELIKKERNSNQPVMIITESDNEAYLIHLKLKRAGIKNTLLTSKGEINETEIINNAGEVGKVTVTTNMSGRGTDIKIKDEALEAGGLFLIITSYSISKRIDRQARGRTARQGNPGKFIFLASLEDELFYYMKEEEINKIKKAIEKNNNKMGIRIIENAQKKVQENLEKGRYIKTIFDDIIEQFRLRIKKDKEIITNKIRDNDIKGITKEIGNKTEIETAIYNRTKEYGKDLIFRTAEEIINTYMLQKWVYAKNAMEEYRNELILSSFKTSYEEIFYSFINKCDEIYKEYLKDVITAVLTALATLKKVS